MFKRVAFLYQVVYNERNPFIMKKNIAIICLDKAMARSTAQLLADQLTMRFFDMRELFEFDHKPHSFKDMLGDYGITYYRQKELGILKYASDFENIVFNIDSDVLYKKDTLKNLAENFLIIYMHINPALALKIVNKEEYCCYKEKSMYALTKDKLTTRIENVRSQADIEVNVSSSTYFKASSDIMRAIQKYYGITSKK